VGLTLGLRVYRELGRQLILGRHTADHSCAVVGRKQIFSLHRVDVRPGHISQETVYSYGALVILVRFGTPWSCRCYCYHLLAVVCELPTGDWTDGS